VAMTGSLGIGGDLNKWSDENNALAVRMISFYKQIRATVRDGKLYRLRLPIESNFSASEYVSGDGRQTVLFAFLHSQQFGQNTPLLRLQGLIEDATYSVKTIDAKLQNRTEKMSGAYLMHHGIQLRMGGD
jgi:alpha-galactosidase